MDKLKKANKELQNRIVKKDLEIKKLTEEVLKYKDLFNNSLLKVNELRVQVRTLKGKKANRSFAGVKVDREAVRKNRAKKIYGILKNRSRYKYTDLEHSFLTQIQYLPKLTDKQFKWYKDIVNRGFTKPKRRKVANTKHFS